MDVTREVRPLEYEVVPFAGREAETITVLAEHRAIGFSLAAAKVHDPADVWKVRLLRDNGRFLDPNDPESSQNIPLLHDPEVYLNLEISENQIYKFRSYELYFDMFGNCEAREGVTVAGRWNAFTAAVLASDMVGNAVYEVWHSSIDANDVDPAVEYGGVYVDLNDTPHWMWKTRQRPLSP